MQYCTWYEIVLPLNLTALDNTLKVNYPEPPLSADHSEWVCPSPALAMLQVGNALVDIYTLEVPHTSTAEQPRPLAVCWPRQDAGAAGAGWAKQGVDSEGEAAARSH